MASGVLVSLKTITTHTHRRRRPGMIIFGVSRPGPFIFGVLRPTGPLNPTPSNNLITPFVLRIGANSDTDILLSSAW